MSEFRINKICDKLEETEIENQKILTQVKNVRFSVPDMEWQDYYDNIQSDLEISLKQLVRIRWLMFKNGDVSDESLMFYEREIDSVRSYITTLKSNEKVLMN